MPLFYTPLLHPGDSFFTLSAEESKHCCQVLRMKEGEMLELIDGRGGYYKAKISEANKSHTKVSIIQCEQNYGKRNFSISIAIAPTKNIDRLEWFIEKSTEIGIDRIIPIKCRYSERKELKIERLKKVMISAMKQSKKAYFPQLDILTPIEKLFAMKFSETKFIAHCYSQDQKLLSKSYDPLQSVLILIGPEGDFSKYEVESALKNGFEPVSLGSSRLRTETAALVACHTINLLNQ